MIGWVRWLLTHQHRIWTDSGDVQITDPEEKHEAEERVRRVSQLVWLLEEQAKAMTIGTDDGTQR